MLAAARRCGTRHPRALFSPSLFAFGTSRRGVSAGVPVSHRAWRPLASIRALVSNLPADRLPYFRQCLRLNDLANGKPEPYYAITGDGFALLVMGSGRSRAGAARAAAPRRVSPGARQPRGAQRRARAYQTSNGAGTHEGRGPSPMTASLSPVLSPLPVGTRLPRGWPTP